MVDEGELSLQTGQVGEVSSDCDVEEAFHPKEYQEPVFWTPKESLSERIVTKSKEILGFLLLLEPAWILKIKSKGSEVYDKIVENLMGNNRDLEASQIVEKCEELCIVERKMLEYELWLCANTEDGGEALRDLEERCRAVRTSIECSRQCLMYISKSIGAVNGNSDYAIQVETYNINTPAPVRINDDLLREAIAECNQFVANSKNKLWNIKAKAVYDLQTFVREKLAVNRESFCF